jgi:hypothetical protein
MARLTLKERLERYFREHLGWVSKGEIRRLVAEHTKHTPENAGRRLRELEEGSAIEVTYRRGHAFYQAKLSADEVFASL